MSRRVVALALAVLSAAAGRAAAADNAVVEMGTRVTGNQEQPRVLYIVPWQAPDGPDALYQDIASRVDNLLDPVDRDAFRRELSLRRQFDQHHSDPAQAQP